MYGLMNVMLSWDIGNFLQNSKSTLITWGDYLMMLIGVILVIVAVYQLAKKFIAPQSAPGGWVMPIVMLIIGGALLVGGWALISDISSGGEQTIRDLGETIIPFLK